MAEQLTVHGLLQKARVDATALRGEYHFSADGSLYRKTPNGWRLVGGLLCADDREDFLVSKLTQEGL